MSRTPHAKPAHSTASIAFGFFSTETPVAAFTTPARKLTPLTSLLRLALPAQTVDATPSNQLIRQYFPWRTDLFGCTRSKPSQGSVPADLTWRAILAFVFNARWVRAECCVDPLRSPDLSGTWNGSRKHKQLFQAPAAENLVDDEEQFR